MLGFEIIEKAGLVVKHMLGVVLLCWRRMARAGLISGGVGFVLVETVGALAQKHFPTPVLTTVVAFFFAIALAYSVMLTVLIDELIIGSIELIRVLEGDLLGGARALAIATERRAGDAGSGIMRWLGHPVAPSPTPAPSPILAPAYAEPTETQADIEATDEFTSTLPRPRVNARPVSAGQLPRISWAMEQLEQQEAQERLEQQEAQEPQEPQEPQVPEYAVPVPDSRSETTAADEPISRPISQPVVEGQRSIWSRISKTLVGEVHPPVDVLEDSVAESRGHDDLSLG